MVVELTHLATLYHDDVMDEALLRRGADSANARWDNTVAILTGDFLFARASDMLADLGPEAVRLQARTFERLVHRSDPRDRRARPTARPGRALPAGAGGQDRVADRVRRLVSAPCSPARRRRSTELLTQWGERIGVAFQLSDDMLDIASESAESGKTPGTDLREGVPTLPVLLLRRDAAAGRRGSARRARPVTCPTMPRSPRCWPSCGRTR